MYFLIFCSTKRYLSTVFYERNNWIKPLVVVCIEETGQYTFLSVIYITAVDYGGR